ncbi:MAG: hypothetical protein ABI867_21115 [Kofleriaceae bacterium]
MSTRLASRAGFENTVGEVPLCYGPAVPDDERTRRRLGDETKGRIADLASGWTVESPPEAKESKAQATPAPEPAAAPRQRRNAKTIPPPPPGSVERKALEEAILDANTPLPIPDPRTKPPTAPPRPGTATGGLAKPFARSGPTETGTVERSGVIGSTGRTPKSAMKSGPTETSVERSGEIDPKKVNERSGLIGAGDEMAASASGAIPISNRSAAIVNSAPIAVKPPPVPPRVPPPPPIGKRIGGDTGSTLAIAPRALPLKPPEADTTNVSPPPSAMPPPLPSTRALRIDAQIHPHDESIETIVEEHPSTLPRLAVPIGEFETGDGAGTMVEEDKRRIAYEQSTIKRDASNALLGLAEPSSTVVKPPSVQALLEETAQHLRGDPTTLDAPETARFERGDPTQGSGDPTHASVPSAGNTAAGRLRSGASLRRKRGFGGDLRYVATVTFGVRNARRELASLDAKQEIRQASRRRHLVTLGRAAATLDPARFDHPALGPARDQLGGVEEERSQHAGSVAAADAERDRVQRDRETKVKKLRADLDACDSELAEITKKLEPLEKETIAVGRRVADLRDSLRRIDAKITATESSQHAVNKKTELSGIQAEIATLRADRVAVERDEPLLAAELDALNPRIAALEARRAEVRKHRNELEQNETEDQRRTEELLAAIGAKRKVVDRATNDAESARDKILFQLGERLYVDRPRDLTAQLAPIDVIDVELGTGDRRSMELREIISSVDKAKLWRGIAYLTLITLAVAGTLLGFLVLAEVI